MTPIEQKAKELIEKFAGELQDNFVGQKFHTTEQLNHGKFDALLAVQHTIELLERITDYEGNISFRSTFTGNYTDTETELSMYRELEKLLKI